MNMKALDMEMYSGIQKESEPTLDYIKVLLRHKWKILFFGLLFAVIAAAFTQYLVPRFLASATILILDEKAPKVLEIDHLYTQSDNTDENFLTQLELMRSVSQAERVVSKLELYNNPILNGTFKNKTPLDHIIELSGIAPAEIETGPVSDQDKLNIAVGNLHKNLIIEHVRKTRLVKISYESTDPDLAAQIVNAVAANYIDSEFEAKLETSNKVSFWLNDQLENLKNNLKSSEEALQAYRETSGLLDIRGVKTLDSNQLDLLTDQYIQARGRRNESAVIYNKINSLGTNPSIQSLMGISAILQDPLVRNLRQAEARAELKVAELSKVFGAKHPRMVAASAELKSAEDALSQQVYRVADTIESDYNLAVANEKALKEQIDNSKSSLQNVTRKEIKLNELEREVSANRQLLDLFLSRTKEANQVESLQSERARVVDEAKAPSIPFFPNKKLIVASSFFLGSIIAAAIAFILALRNKTLRTAKEVSIQTGVEVLGKIPRTKNNNAQVFWNSDDLKFVEAIRTFRTYFVFSSLDNPYQVSMITSSRPGEGKSTTTLNLAYALAQMERTLVIDADLRRAGLTHKISVDEDTPGLTDLLSHTAELNQCITPINDQLEMIGAGSMCKNSLELLSSPRMNKLINILREKYDRIIIDSPPINAVVDAVAISKQVDAIVYVIKAGSTSMEEVEQGISALKRADGNIIGAVLNGVAEKDEDYVGEYSGYGYLIEDKS